MELGLGGELAAARLKVLAALPHELQERATRASRLFHLDTRGWFRAEDRVPHLPALSSAVWRGCRVRLRYREGGRVVQRTIDPLGLVLKGGAWYLVARRSAGMRVYRVSRVASVRPLEASFERPAQFELADFWERVVAELRAEPAAGPGDACGWTRRCGASSPASRGSRRTVAPSLAFSHLGDAYRELLRFGSQVEVLEPAELRERVAETGREVAALYGS